MDIAKLTGALGALREDAGVEAFDAAARRLGYHRVAAPRVAVIANRAALRELAGLAELVDAAIERAFSPPPDVPLALDETTALPLDPAPRKPKARKGEK